MLHTLWHNNAFVYVVLVIMIWLVFNAVWSFSVDLLKERREAKKRNDWYRTEYQRRMRHVASLMVEHIDAEIIDDLEWQFQTLLYEYRRCP